MTSAAVRGSRSTKHFLIVADGSADHLRRDREKALVEGSHQHNRPLDEPGNFIEQPGVFDQLVALRKGEVLGVSQYHLLAALRIENNLRLFQLGCIISEAAHLEWLRAEETVAARLVARRDAVHGEANNIGLLRLRSKCRDNGMQRPHPAQRCRVRTVSVRFRGIKRRLGRLSAPTHRLGPGKISDHLRHELRDDVDRRSPRLFGHRHVKIALLVVRNLCFGDGSQSGRAQKAGNGAFRRPDTGTLFLLLHIGLPCGNALDGQRQTPRRNESPGALVEKACLDQAIGYNPAQIIGRARLHARRNFLGKQLKQKVGHGGQKWRRRRGYRM